VSWGPGNLLAVTPRHARNDEKGQPAGPVQVHEIRNASFSKHNAFYGPFFHASVINVHFCWLCIFFCCIEKFNWGKMHFFQNYHGFRV
jgi:hypothetical protein